MSVGYVYDPVYLMHETGDHPEHPSRLRAIVDELTAGGVIERLVDLPARTATLDELIRVHTPTQVSRIEQVARQGGGWLNPDTVLSRLSYDVALQAAGGAIQAVDAVLDGQVASAFALVRPPGHHATPDEAMGFCIFNNIAIATVHALERRGLERILIVDWDVHHGNGTQDCFYRDPRVLFFSTHESPLYPGTGSIGEIGAGPGAGTTVNVPLPAGCGDAEYWRVYREILVPVAERFQPEMILVSAGFDPHWHDPLARMQLSVAGFAGLAGLVQELAAEHCQGKLALCLEGGYALPALAASVRAVFQTLLGDTRIADPIGPPPERHYAPSIDVILEAVRRTHHLAER